jgi:hypothetical protein
MKEFKRDREDENYRAVQHYLKRQGVTSHMTHNPDIRGAIIALKELRNKDVQIFDNK